MSCIKNKSHHGLCKGSVFDVDGRSLRSSLKVPGSNLRFAEI